MPALPSPGKVVKVDVFQSLGDDIHALNSYFLGYTGASSQADLDTLCAAAVTGWQTEILSEQVNDNVLDEIVMTDLVSDTAPRSVVTSGVSGSVSGGAMGAATAMVFSFPTGRRFRGGHSRLYLGGLPQTVLQDPQHWSSSIVTTMGGRWDAFIDDQTDAITLSVMGVIRQVAVSYFQGFTVVTNPITHRARNVPTLRGTPLVEDVVNVRVSNRVASQRRRNLQSS